MEEVYLLSKLTSLSFVSIDRMQLCLGMRLRGALLYEHEYFMWTYFNSYETLRDLTFVYDGKLKIVFESTPLIKFARRAGVVKTVRPRAFFRSFPLRTTNKQYNTSRHT